MQFAFLYENVSILFIKGRRINEKFILNEIPVLKESRTETIYEISFYILNLNSYF